MTGFCIFLDTLKVAQLVNKLFTLYGSQPLDTILCKKKIQEMSNSLTLLWYHGVNVTPFLFDSRFFLNCHEY